MGARMDEQSAAKAAEYLDELCLRYPDRHVGGEGNEAGNALFERVAVAVGFAVESIEFECVEWLRGKVVLEAAGERFEAHAGPYSLPCDLEAPLAVVDSVEELERGSFEGVVLLVAGELAREQVMPKGFDFYNPDEHRRIVAAFERQRPSAIVAATGRNPSLAGGLYPFPLLEDADFDIPNAYLTDVAGAKLAALAGESVRLRIDSGRAPARAQQLIARREGSGPGRVVVSAHIDSKEGTPGALDNASGVAALLLLAEALGDHCGTLTVELVPFNGEDYYAAPGQKLYLAHNRSSLGDIVLEMNLDGAGFVGKRTSVSTYGCSEELQDIIRKAIARRAGLAEGPSWFQSDHAIFAMHGVPALAITSENFLELSTEYTHTARDLPELVDPGIVAEAAAFLADVIERIDEAVVPVRMFGLLHAHREERGLPSVVNVPISEEGTPARSIAASLDLPVELIEGAFVNGTVYGIDHEVRRGDRLAFVPQGTPGPHRVFLGLYRAGQEGRERAEHPTDE